MIGRRALPWTAYRRLRDQTTRTRPGRHERSVSPTHVPAWPFNHRSAS